MALFLSRSNWVLAASGRAEPGTDHLGLRIGQFMTTVTFISGFMILAGAGVMAMNIVKFMSLPRLLEQFSFEGHHNFWRFFRVHQLLMLFFLLGYVAVFVSLFQRIEFVGVFFVGVIFFFGALFVYLGILLQLKMLATINAGYQEAVSIGAELDRERSNLLETNRKLTNEIQERQEVEYNLRESREQLKATWDSISAGIIVIDEETHRIADANPSALSMIGASREKVLDNICHRFICPAELGSCPVTDKEEKVDKSERNAPDHHRRTGTHTENGDGNKCEGPEAFIGNIYRHHPT